ncbi:hypothetical protein Tco_0402782, partial [Tanacetum coccineum]
NHSNKFAPRSVQLNAGRPEFNSVRPNINTVNTGRLDHDDSLMLELEIFHKPETGIFDEASYDEEGVITDFNSLPTVRIHSIHPKSQILGDPKSAVQTRSKVQEIKSSCFSQSYSQATKKQSQRSTA